MTIRPNPNIEDTIRWIDNKQGNFTSKSLYDMLDNKVSQ